MEVGVKRSYTIKNRYNSIAIQWTVFSVSFTMYSANRSYRNESKIQNAKKKDSRACLDDNPSA